MYDDFAASVSGMMVSVYGVAIVKPAEGKTQDVVDAMDAYVQSQQKAMERYLEDQYEIASAARVATVPTGEVVMVCCEDSDTVFEKHQKRLWPHNVSVGKSPRFQLEAGALLYWLITDSRWRSRACWRCTGGP